MTDSQFSEFVNILLSISGCMMFALGYLAGLKSA